MNDISFEQSRSVYRDALNAVFRKKRNITIAMHITNIEWTKHFDALRAFGVAIIEGKYPDRYFLTANTTVITDAATSLLLENGLQRKNPPFKIIERLMMWAFQDAIREETCSRFDLERAKTICDFYRDLEQVMRIDTTFVSATDC